MEQGRQHNAVTVNNEKGSTPISVGAQYVMPGEVRTFPWHDVPPHLWPQAAEATPAAPDPAAERRAFLAGLLALPLREMAEKLPFPSLEDLAALEELEAAAPSPRKDLLEAIAAEKIRRAGVPADILAAQAREAEAHAAMEAEAKAQAEADEKARAETDATAQADAAAAIEQRKAELAEILKKNVGDVREHFSALSDADLRMMGELERERGTGLLAGLLGGARKGVLTPIAEELIERAKANANGGG